MNTERRYGRGRRLIGTICVLVIIIVVALAYAGYPIDKLFGPGSGLPGPLQPRSVAASENTHPVVVTPQNEASTRRAENLAVMGCIRGSEERGTLSRYSDGVAERVISRRQNNCCAEDLPKPLPKTDGYVAVYNCSDIRDIYMVKIPDGRTWSLLAIDCAAPDAKTWMTKGGIVGEVDHQTAVEMGMAPGRGLRNVDMCKIADYK